MRSGVDACVCNRGRHVPACSHLHSREDMCEWVWQLECVCVIRVKKCGYLCHFGQSGKGRHCVCNLYTQGEGVYVWVYMLKRACSRGEHGEVCSGAVHVCVCAAGGGGVPGIQVYGCECQRASLQAAEGVALQWLEGLPCRGGPSSGVWDREPGEALRTKESPLPPPSLLVQGHSPCPA